MMKRPRTSKVAKTVKLLKIMIASALYIKATIEMNTVRQYLVRINRPCKNDGS